MMSASRSPVSPSDVGHRLCSLKWSGFFLFGLFVMSVLSISVLAGKMHLHVERDVEQFDKLTDLTSETSEALLQSLIQPALQRGTHAQETSRSMGSASSPLPVRPAASTLLILTNSTELSLPLSQVKTPRSDWEQEKRHNQKTESQQKQKKKKLKRHQYTTKETGVFICLCLRVCLFPAPVSDSSVDLDNNRSGSKKIGEGKTPRPSTVDVTHENLSELRRCEWYQ